MTVGRSIQVHWPACEVPTLEQQNYHHNTMEYSPAVTGRESVQLAHPKQSEWRPYTSQGSTCTSSKPFLALQRCSLLRALFQFLPHVNIRPSLALSTITPLGFWDRHLGLTFCGMCVSENITLLVARFKVVAACAAQRLSTQTVEDLSEENWREEKSFGTFKVLTVIQPQTSCWSEKYG